MICNGCGGVVGRDCYNPQECEQISRRQEAHYAAEQANQPLYDEIDKLKAEIAELHERLSAQQKGGE